MYEKVCEILLNYVEEPEGGLTPETRFIDDLAMNSLDIMTMVGDLEDEFDITIETPELRNLFTIRELVKFLEGKV
ncbi:MAG: acyl carrier protein [Oscillospiraceae bacterium]|nr:acyl carrier protein [Oscillospiraceae bacterium]MBR0200538.1 acyl carrier protein [Oscillospiraceae bacterium]